MLVTPAKQPGSVCANYLLMVGEEKSVTGGVLVAPVVSGRQLARLARSEHGSWRKSVGELRGNDGLFFNYLPDKSDKCR